LLVADDAPYDETRKIWNAMIDRRPGAHRARCSGTADVVRAVRFARAHRIVNSVRGGGHNIAGLAVCDGGLMIDLSLLRGVWVDAAARTCRAQAGCTLGDVDSETQLHGWRPYSASSRPHGIAGLTVGGGFGLSHTPARLDLRQTSSRWTW
jgi:FAD/FMN-containing dehydrogenase